MKPKRRLAGARHRHPPDAAPVAAPPPQPVNSWIPHAFTAALRSQQAGQLDQARQLYIRILEQDPRHSDAMYFLASIAGQVGDLALATDLLKQAIAVEPRKTAYHVLLGNALQKSGHLELSKTCYENALRLEPNSVDAHYNLGNTLERLGAFQEATRHFARAVALDPAHIEARNNLGNMYRVAGRFQEALECYEFALRLTPQSMPLHLNSGNAHMAEGRHEQALECFDRAVALMPQLGPLHNNRGNALRQLSRYQEALDAFRQALSLQPGCGEFLVNLAQTYQALGRMPEALEAFRTLLRQQDHSAVAASAALFTFHYDPAMTAERLAIEHRFWGERFGKPLSRGGRPFANRPEPERRLRVGYVSPDFRQHPVAMFTAPVLAAHDREKVDVFCYASITREDAWTERVRKGTDHWRNVLGWSDGELAAKVEADRIDILVDLSGHTAGNRLMAFAQKPAPVQVSWLGYFNTTGLAAVDYLVVDSTLAPPDETCLFVEAPLRLPGAYLCYLLPDYAPAPRRVAGTWTYGCFNTISKITPGVVDCWARILRAQPEARLLLKNSLLAEERTRCLCRDQFAQHGVEPDRVLLEGACTHAELLGEYSRVDVALDPFPYNGGTTTCEALAMGVPVVSMRGDRFVSRVGATILEHAGLADCVVADEAGYIDCALRLGREAAAHDRTEFASRVARSPLGNVKGFARGLEAAYRSAWRAWCERHV